MALKTIFWCLTPGEWKRGTLAEAQALALKSGRLTTHIFYQAIFSKETTKEELSKLETFWCIAGMGELVRCDDLTEEDEALIDKCLVGWLTHEYKVETKRAKKK